MEGGLITLEPLRKEEEKHFFHKRKKCFKKVYRNMNHNGLERGGTLVGTLKKIVTSLISRLFCLPVQLDNTEHKHKHAQVLRIKKKIFFKHLQFLKMLKICIGFNRRKKIIEGLEKERKKSTNKCLVFTPPPTPLLLNGNFK